MSFESFGFTADILSALSDEGYVKPTVIQKMSIPKILAGKDVIAGAQTGTGKTASYLLPLIHKMVTRNSESGIRRANGLILLPTRELAQQVLVSFEKYTRNTDLCAVALFGGVEYGPQQRKLEAGVDLIIATPGRLLDVIDRFKPELFDLKYLVFDEADRMLDMGFSPAVHKILRHVPCNRQTMLFSATFSEDVRSLSRAFMRSPETIQAEKLNSAAKKITHVVHPVDIEKKRPLLSFLIGSNNWQQVLIFARTKASADSLAKELHLDGIRNMVIHGDKTQGYRTKALEHFKQGKIQALVATDIAARGLDIVSLPYVINYELPHNPEDYIHRVGRTGRAGQSGLAVTLVTDREVFRLMEVEKILGEKLDKKKVSGFEPVNFDPDLALVRHRQKLRAAAIKKHGLKKGAGGSGSRPATGGRSGRQGKKDKFKPRHKSRGGKTTAPKRKSRAR